MAQKAATAASRRPAAMVRPCRKIAHVGCGRVIASPPFGRVATILPQQSFAMMRKSIGAPATFCQQQAKETVFRPLCRSRRPPFGGHFLGLPRDRIVNQAAPADTCQSCTFFRPKEMPIGTCHRFPPQFAGADSPNEAHRWKFPSVGQYGWCGEYRRDSSRA
ncbi:MAG: hypothetical protein PHY45_06885 [Rhodocyclaceae bacterium]|nr:hypothetical protein [Rhodocyclaceae bacterium]